MGSVVLRGHRNGISPPRCSSVMPEARWLPWRKVLPCFSPVSGLTLKWEISVT